MKKTVYFCASVETGGVVAENWDMSKISTDWLLVHTAEVELPDFDITTERVNGIERQIVSIRAEAEAKVTALEAKKQELLALPGGAA